MEWICKTNVLIVGLGVIGGSYAKALKRLGYNVCAIDTDESTIDYALKNGIIDNGSTNADEDMIKNADALVFALYPGIFIDWIKRNQHLFKSGAFITDVTGVKSSVVYTIQSILRPDVEYIAAHPMAGREKSGVEYSDDSIFRGANYLVTPTEKNSELAIQWCKNLGRILGFSKISVLSPQEHDEMIAFVSQLTHCISVALMTCNDNAHLVDYTGDSFRDLTRIASINDRMWSELFLLNKEPLLKQMNIFINELTDIRDKIQYNDVEGLRAKMRLSKERRKAFDGSAGGGKK